MIKIDKKAINPALPPTFGILGPRNIFIKAAITAAPIKNRPDGRISREDIPTNDPQ